MFVLKLFQLLLSPFQEICVLCLTGEHGPHHDSLEALPLDGPQFTVGGSYDKIKQKKIVESRENVGLPIEAKQEVR